MPNIEVPGKGLIAFPDEMSKDDINRAVQTIVAGAPLSGPINGAAPADPIQNAPEVKGVAHGLSTGLDELANTPKALVTMAKHPLNTLEAMGQQQRDLSQRAQDDWNSGHRGNAIWHAADSLVPVLGPMDASLTDQYQGGDKSGAMARGLIEALPSLIDGGEDEGLLKPLTRKVSNTVKEQSGKLLDNGVGLKAADVQREATPGQSYFAGGGTPAIGLKSLAKKAEVVNDNAGSALGKIYSDASPAKPSLDLTDEEVQAPGFDWSSPETADLLKEKQNALRNWRQSSTLFDPNELSDMVQKPVDKLRAMQEGEGGEGETAGLGNYEMRAQRPLAQAINDGEQLSPADLWQFKKNVGANTRWSDPTKFDLNTVRQQTTGALGKVLSDALPDTAPLNKIYQGTKNLAERATQRADSGQGSLGSLATKVGLGTLGHFIGGNHAAALTALLPLLDSVAARSTAGYLGYHLGDLLPTLVKNTARTARPGSAILGEVNPK